MEIKPSRTHALGAVYLANLLLAFHWYTILYINSSFVSKFVGEGQVGLLYTLGSLFNLGVFLATPRILSRIGNYRFIVSVICLEAIAILGLAFAQTPLQVILLFILHQGIVPLILFSLDIFLEKYTTNESTTGGTRGVFLTLANLALVISPSLAALALGEGDFKRVYILSALFLIPLIYLTRFWKKEPKEKLGEVRILHTISMLRKNKDVYTILRANFILQLFYAFMVVYLPLYLHEHVGFSWAEIGTLLTIMFLPFLIFELPLGRLADKRLGEKEILTVGFIVAGIATGLLGTLSTPLFFVWALILFTTRIGASFVEISSESYFFKQVKSENTNLISVFRMTRPLSFIVAPLIASILLPFISYGTLFSLVGIMMIFGIRYSLAIKDTR